MTDLSIIIPAYNVAEFIPETLETILRSKVSTEVVVVDDASSDDTLAVVQRFADKHENIQVVHCPENVGAGVARNIGMKRISGEFVYFLDADDILLDGALEKMVAIMRERSCDVLSFKYGYITSENGKTGPILAKDLKIWNGITTKAGEIKDVDLRKHPRLLLTVNYPWNKIVRRAFIEDSELFFSNTYVNNDIYAHWHIYLRAAKICVLNETLIHHRVFEERAQITNVFDERRFAAFVALNDVESVLVQDDVAARRYYHYFLQFKLELLKWINSRIGRDLRPEFLDRVKHSYDLMHEGLFLQAFDHAPGVAYESITLKAQPKLLLGVSEAK